MHTGGKKKHEGCEKLEKRRNLACLSARAGRVRMHLQQLLFGRRTNQTLHKYSQLDFTQNTSYSMHAKLTKLPKRQNPARSTRRVWKRKSTSWVSRSTSIPVSKTPLKHPPRADAHGFSAVSDISCACPPAAGMAERELGMLRVYKVEWSVSWRRSRVRQVPGDYLIVFKRKLQRESNA